MGAGSELDPTFGAHAQPRRRSSRQSVLRNSGRRASGSPQRDPDEHRPRLPVSGPGFDGPATGCLGRRAADLSRPAPTDIRPGCSEHERSRHRSGRRARIRCRYGADHRDKLDVGGGARARRARGPGTPGRQEIHLRLQEVAIKQTQDHQTLRVEIAVQGLPHPTTQIDLGLILVRQQRPRPLLRELKRLARTPGCHRQGYAARHARASPASVTGSKLRERCRTRLVASEPQPGHLGVASV